MDSIKKLQELFAKFPTIGQRTAGRFVSYLIGQNKQETDELVKAIQELKNNVKLCSFCFNPYETGQDLCLICQNPSRNKQLLCVVEKDADLLSIENTGKYNGLYFILGGTVTLRKIDGSNLRMAELKNRVANGKFAEVIIALNPTPEGKSTSVLVERALKDVSQQSFSASAKGTDASSGAKGGPASGWKITHLAQGLPVGGELEYADEETLESAFEGRK